jgi:phage gp29-like protein
MQLIEALERRIASEESMFRAQLLREDVARLKQAAALAQGSPDAAAYKKAAMRLGWTPGDLRTHELRAPLEAFLDALYDAAQAGGSSEAEAKVATAWFELDRVRIERLIGCLSTPVPKPTE